MTSEMVRMKKMLVALDECMSDATYYDDDKQEDVCELTEEEIYNCLMKNDEFHLLTSEVVKNFIHTFQDHSMRMSILSGFGIL